MNRRPSRLDQFRALTPIQQRTFLQASLWLPWFWLGLRWLGLLRFQSWLQRRALVVSSTMTLSEIQAMGEAVNIAARHTPFHATCLTRSLLLGWMLRRCGVASELRIGVRLPEGLLDAHAWVECNGTPVNDRPDVAKDYTVFGELVPLEAFRAP
jgi:hypothetical protein